MDKLVRPYVPLVPQSGRIDGLGSSDPLFIALGGGAGLLRGSAATTTSTVSSSLVTNSGRVYSGHVLQRMAERGITKKMAEMAIRNGARYYDPKNQVYNYVLRNGFASGKDLLVGVSASGKVTTVIRGANLVNKRFLPL